ncbi:hypothetical protein ASPCADRAFT_132800 [Aspergillus carbonarius ITEM 5010]|uniref:Uncharacterized protein n=1 Tax=Aspergillus carbonarius (strain ITEM 5010) TaxID=602072 RepID=A0A1R3RF19_ASPC5|nr:hypothetical protein ASPCADRAFT_132800 [Aspergillus carbonarius ITEM 5010]
MTSSSQTIRSILFEESWEYHWQSRIIFHADGTGTLIACGELCSFIGLHFNWKIHNPDYLDQVIDPNTHTGRPPQTVCEFSVEITYTTRRPTEFNNRNMRMLNEGTLTAQAFRPKTFQIRLEHGRFFTQWETQRTGVPRWSHPYAWRLVFDRSPYPPREEWTMAWGDGMLDFQRFWERTEFCGRNSELPRENGPWSRFMSWLGYP